jgi:hypothetical protein
MGKHDPLCEAKDCTHVRVWCVHNCICDLLAQARNEAYGLGRDDEADALPLREWVDES